MYLALAWELGGDGLHHNYGHVTSTFCLLMTTFTFKLRSSPVMHPLHYSYTYDRQLRIYSSQQ